MKVSLITYGCRVNQAEFQQLEKYLKQAGYEITENSEEADCWIINTCAVTHKAEIQSRQIINKAIKLGKKCFVTGCYAELYEKKLKEKKLTLISNYEKDSLASLFPPIATKEILPQLKRHRAIVKVQDGCNQFCSYCIVPYLRGKPKSYNADEVLKVIKEYEDMGIKEIVISGINLGLYGKDIKNQLNLNKLLKLILKNSNQCKIRLSSLNVNFIDEEFLEIISHPRICKHLHIPLQSGSDKILNLMRRPYNREKFIKTLDKIFKLYPEIAIGTDVIVGFPSENEADFKDTKKLIEDAEFAYLHVFTYSTRPLTLASKFSEQIPEPIKKERTNQLLEIAKSKKKSYIEKFIGKELEVIVENKKNDLSTGTSDNYIKCIFKKNQVVSGSLVKGKVVQTDDEHAYLIF
ncbi:tRNA (N(6)-L-threonylcarbamoyladenosine(37)-C(2))-methylthiotransferase MtaB [Thermodesulfovibrio hydrogeniphilus]